MNLKISIIVFASLMAICLPYNMIGCSGDDMDPHDYFVSFFDKNLSDDSSLKPFYYTNYQFLYDEAETVDISKVTAAEWIAYTGKQISTQEAYDFVCNFGLKDLTNIYQHIEKKEALTVADSVHKNGLTKYFLETGDREALGYLLYARKLEPFVTGSWSSWEPIERDSLAMSKMIRNGQQLLAAGKKDFVRMRYAYQVIRLAHYSKRYQDCINWYDELMRPLPATGIIPELSISLKAGALMRIGKKNEAAYEFSKLFSRNKFKRVSNYMSFDWSVKRFDAKNRAACIALCKNDREKADMLGLFALGSNENELSTIAQIYKLNQESPLLPLLTIRELHKVEEYYFTPGLSMGTGNGISLNSYRSADEADKLFQAYKKETKGLADLCKNIGDNVKVPNNQLFTIAAAHATMINHDYNEAGKLLNKVNRKLLVNNLADQWNMTNILVTINSKDSITPAFEDQLLPSIRWLGAKAASNPEYAKFYRRLFADVLANKYKRMKGPASIKYMLCKGVADHISKDSDHDGWGYYASSLSELRTDVPAIQIDRLIQIVENQKPSGFDKFLISNSDFTKDDLNDIAGTGWLREFNFAIAQKWFGRVSAGYYKKEPFKTYLAANPFADLLLDTHAPTRQDTAVYTKLTFARKMLALQNLVSSSTDEAKKAEACYELAKGYYHMSYWGNSWLLVQYNWSSYYTADDNTSGSKIGNEYYTVNKAKEFYLKAYNAYTDKNKKAKALFMASKCDQKGAGMPEYNAFGATKEYDRAIKKWVMELDKKNKYFSTLSKDYSNTTFYKEAIQACSFLKDFVRKEQR